MLGVESKSDRLVSGQTKILPSTLNPTSVTHVNIELTSDISTQLQSHTESYENICLTGLHACGDLTPWSLNLFLNEPKYQLLAIVPCCYHKMNFQGNPEVSSFPLSQMLKTQLNEQFVNHEFLQNQQLCRLASQRDRESFLNDIQAETNHVFFRSLLELYVHQGTSQFSPFHNLSGPLSG